MINIAEILKKAPKGTKLYTPIFGECELQYVNNELTTIWISIKEQSRSFNAFGQFDSRGECLLFPSKKQRAWSKFKVPYQFKPFDKVLVRDFEDDEWKCNFFSHIGDNKLHPHSCVSGRWLYCLPYNEETAKLIGTTDDYNG